VSSLRGTIMVIGASDTGKSTLAATCFRSCVGPAFACLPGRRCGSEHVRPAGDHDGGPSSRAGDERFSPRGPRVAYFVGSTTPRGHMLPVVVGAYRLQQKALALVLNGGGRYHRAGRSGGRGQGAQAVEDRAVGAFDSDRPATGTGAGVDLVAAAPRGSAPGNRVAGLAPCVERPARRASPGGEVNWPIISGKRASALCRCARRRSMIWTGWLLVCC